MDVHRTHKTCKELKIMPFFLHCFHVVPEFTFLIFIYLFVHRLQPTSYMSNLPTHPHPPFPSCFPLLPGCPSLPNPLPHLAFLVYSCVQGCPSMFSAMILLCTEAFVQNGMVNGIHLEALAQPSFTTH